MQSHQKGVQPSVSFHPRLVDKFQRFVDEKKVSQRSARFISKALNHIQTGLSEPLGHALPLDRIDIYQPDGTIQHLIKRYRLFVFIRSDGINRNVEEIDCACDPLSPYLKFLAPYLEKIFKMQRDYGVNINIVLAPHANFQENDTLDFIFTFLQDGYEPKVRHFKNIQIMVQKPH